MQSNYNIFFIELRYKDGTRRDTQKGILLTRINFTVVLGLEQKLAESVRR